MDHTAHSLVTLLTMLLQLLNLYVPNENSMPTNYTAKMNHTDTTNLIQNASYSFYERETQNIPPHCVTYSHIY